MHLIEMDVISELHKGAKASEKALRFFADTDKHDHAIYSVDRLMAAINPLGARVDVAAKARVPHAA
jgi:hypothetical protein